MIDRSEAILLSLMRADGPLTSLQLANNVGVSSRTIKAAMPQVARVLEEHGAHLMSRRNRGYWIAVECDEKYQELTERIELRSLHIDMASYDHAMRALHIARRLVSSPQGVLIDQLSDELALSRSAIQRPLHEALGFLKDFRLEVTSSPGRGMRVVAEEQMIRLALVELFEIHFDRYVPDDSVPEYSRWIACGYQERQDIRHIFLRVLRNSPISMRDGMTQRLAVYLVVMRNRINAGYRVLLPKNWLREIRQTVCYDVAVDILSALSCRFPGYGVSNDETAFFAILLLRWLDVNLARDARAVSPYLYPGAKLAAYHVIESLDGELGGVASIENVRPFMVQCLLPLVAAHRYGLDGYELYDNESSGFDSVDPVCTYLSIRLGSLIEGAVGLRLAQSDYHFLSMVAAWLVDGVRVPVNPLRILVTHAAGTEFASRQLERLRAAWPDLIDESSSACELYEIRGMDPDGYDAVVTHVVTGYRYDAPHVPCGARIDTTDLMEIHDTILISAYGCDEYFWREDQVHVYRGLTFSSAEQFVQALALQFDDEPMLHSEFQKAMMRQMRLMGSKTMRGIGFLFGTVSLPEEESVGWYQLDEPLAWGKGGVCAIMHIRICQARGLVRMQALGRSLSHIAPPSTGQSPSSDSVASLLNSGLRASFRFSGVSTDS